MIGKESKVIGPDAIRELRIGDQEGGDAAGMQLLHEGVDLRIHDRLAHQRQRTVPWLRHIMLL